MNTPQEHDFASHQLLINKSPAHPRIKAARLFKDAKDAAAIGRLSLVVLGRTIDETILFGAGGTFVALTPVPPLLQGMGCGGTEPLTNLIASLNSLLKTRAEAIQSAPNLGAARGFLAVIGNMFDQFLDPTGEVAAELVDNVSLDVRPVLVDQLG